MYVIISNMPHRIGLNFYAMDFFTMDFLNIGKKLFNSQGEVILLTKTFFIAQIWEDITLNRMAPCVYKTENSKRYCELAQDKPLIGPDFCLFSKFVLP